MKKFLVFLICGIISSAAIAQENISKSRWYIQALAGVNTMGSDYMGIGNFKHNIGPAASLEMGYEFNPYIALGLQAQYDRLNYKPAENADAKGFNSIEGSLNLYWNLTNTFLGYKPNRKNAVRLYAGFAVANPSNLQDGYYVGDGTDNNNSLGYRAGIQYERNLGKQWGFVIDGGINSFNEKFTSIPNATGMDSHINLMVGVRKYFGTYRKHRSDFKETIVNTIIKRDTVHVKDVVEKKAPKEVYSIFFTIDKIDINASEVSKIKAVADYMKANPEKVVFVFGYADKNTGTAKRNSWLAKNRARVVIEQLTDTYGINPARIISYEQEGDKVQPYSEDEYEKNRSTICVITDLVR